MSQGGSTTTVTVTATTNSQRGVGCTRYCCSIFGIVHIIATVLAFGAFVALEVFKGDMQSLNLNAPPEFASRAKAMFDAWWRLETHHLMFHEFSTCASWLFLMAFVIMLGVRLQGVCGCAPKIVKYITIGNSCLWGLMLVVSSALVLDVFSKPATALRLAASVNPVLASGALGILGFLALIVHVVLLAKDDACLAVM